MAHKVICSVCKQQFDRDKEPYAITGSRRYAHKDCFLKINPLGSQNSIIDPLDSVECCYCHKTFKKSETEYLPIGKKFAHKACAEAHPEDKDKQTLDTYLIKVFNTDYVPPLVQRQIKDYIDKYKFTYKGIYQALKYFYEVKKTGLPKNQSIGIVPYVYTEAQAYFGKLETIKQVNQNVSIKKVEKEIVYINRPQRNINKKKFFTFLDEEE